MTLSYFPGAIRALHHVQHDLYRALRIPHTVIVLLAGFGRPHLVVSFLVLPRASATFLVAPVILAVALPADEPHLYDNGRMLYPNTTTADASGEDRENGSNWARRRKSVLTFVLYLKYVHWFVLCALSYPFFCITYYFHLHSSIFKSLVHLGRFGYCHSNTQNRNVASCPWSDWQFSVCTFYRPIYMITLIWWLLI